MQFSVKVLASGSKANCYAITAGNTTVFIDIGLTASAIKRQANECDLDLNNIDGILITHEHCDHIKGLGVFTSQFNTPVYCNDLTHVAIERKLKYNKYHCRKELACYENGFYIKDIFVQPFRISHDAVYPMGYTLTHKNESLTLVTDTGYLTQGMIRQLDKSSTVIIESNHDVNMLNKGKYPPDLKKRILSNVGHLSNETCSRAIAEIGKNSIERRIILSHISMENNTPKIAYDCACKPIKENKFDHIKLFVADQNNVLFVN